MIGVEEIEILNWSSVQRFLVKTFQNQISKKANYSINFNLGDIYYISYTKKQIRKLKNLIKQLILRIAFLKMKY